MLLALYFAAFAAAVILVLTVIVTLNRAVALSAGLLALLLVGWALLQKPARRISAHPRIQRWLPMGALGITVAVLALIVYQSLLAPAPPYTPITPTLAIRYWDLSTGSRIAYTHQPAQTVQGYPPVVLVHGGPGAPPARQPMISDALAEAGFTVYAYHQVGAGLSSRLDDVRQYTVARHVADLEAIRQLIGAERVILIGGSWGGQLIANYLATYPERVHKAVVASPGAIWPPAFTQETRLTAAGAQDVEAAVAQYPRFVLAHALMQTIGPQPAYALLPDQHMDGVFQQFVRSLDMAPGCPQIQAQASADRQAPAGIGFWVNAITTANAAQVADPRPALRTVTTPVLVLRGECDYVAEAVTREYQAVLPNATLRTIDAAGHTIETHQPEAYREAVLSFLLDAPAP